MRISAQDILAKRAKEVLAKRKAHESLIGHISYIDPNFKWADHHIKMATLWDRVLSGELKNLLIMVPPRHGKSQTTKHAVSFGMQEYGLDMVLSTYNDDFASDYGGEIKDLYLSKKFKSLYEAEEDLEKGIEAVKIDLDPSNRSNGDWTTLQGRRLKSTGVAGTLTGMGGQILIVDDPVKDQKSADSKKIREAIWKWYLTVFRTRRTFKKGFGRGAIVVIMTRWHEDDLAGRILEQSTEKWEVIKLKAIENEGSRWEKALWPEFYDLDYLKEQRALDQRGFSSLYQQEPSPEEGINFKREDLELYKPSDRPEELSLYMSWDCAASDNSGDYTEIAVFGVDTVGVTWLVEGYYGQVSSNIWVDEALDYVEKYKPLYLFGEKGLIFKSIDPFFKKRMFERGLFVKTHNVARNNSLNKEAAIQGALATTKIRRFKLPDTEYGRRAREQLIKFPSGKYDDCVDMISNFFMNMDKVNSSVKKQIIKPGKMDGYKRCSSGLKFNKWKMQ